MLDANDDLLPRITTFRITDRVIVAGFIHHGIAVNVDAETRDAGLDAQYLDRIISDNHSAGINQRLSQSSNPVRADEQVETVLGRVRVADDIYGFALKFRDGNVAGIPEQLLHRHCRGAED